MKNSDSKKQSLIIIGIGLIVLSGLFFYFALSQPRVLISDNNVSASVSESVSTELIEENISSTEPESFANQVSYPLNLNTCTIDELVTLDGIGEVKADAIIQYREYLGGYTSVDQIMNIKGIGESIYEKVAPYLTV